MGYKVFIFSDNILKGQDKFDFSLFNKVCLENLIDIDSINIDKFDIDREFIKENENLIVFCENKNLDNLIIKNIRFLGSKKTFVDEQIVIFDKAGTKVIFAPIESDLRLLNKVFIKDENKKYCQFHLFGLSKEQIQERLERLKQRIDGFSYKFICDNLLCDIVLSYNGKINLIDDNMVLIASEFKENVYSENNMLLPEIVVKMLKLKDKSLAVVENVTQGRVIESLLGEGDSSFLKGAWFEQISSIDTDILCEKVEEYKKKSQADVIVIMSGNDDENGLVLNFAIAGGEEIHIYKNNFKADKESCIEMAKNSILFHLAKRLRQKDVGQH